MNEWDIRFTGKTWFVAALLVWIAYHAARDCWGIMWLLLHTTTR